jgi:hypothetical protein
MAERAGVWLVRVEIDILAFMSRAAPVLVVVAVSS